MERRRKEEKRREGEKRERDTYTHTQKKERSVVNRQASK